MSAASLILAVMLVPSVAMLALGVRLLSRRAMVVRSQVMLGFMALLFLPQLIRVTVLLFSEPGHLGAWLLALASLVIWFVVFLLLRRAFGRVTLWNVDEETVYNALDRVLNDRGIGHREHRSQILLDDHDAVVKVNIQGTVHTGTLAVEGKDSKVLAPQLFPALSAALGGTKSGRRSTVGIAYTVMGAVTTAMLALLLIAVVQDS